MYIVIKDKDFEFQYVKFQNRHIINAHRNLLPTKYVNRHTYFYLLIVPKYLMGYQICEISIFVYRLKK